MFLATMARAAARRVCVDRLAVGKCDDGEQARMTTLIDRRRRVMVRPQQGDQNEVGACDRRQRA